MSSRLTLILAAASGFFYVAFGAFCAHVLINIMDDIQLSWLQIGLQYQGFHTLVLLVIGFAMLQWSSHYWNWSALFFALGILLFSGSLYLLALTDLPFWIFVTPIGGICFLLGWVILLVGSLVLSKKQKAQRTVEKIASNVKKTVSSKAKVVSSKVKAVKKEGQQVKAAVSSKAKTATSKVKAAVKQGKKTPSKLKKVIVKKGNALAKKAK